MRHFALRTLFDWDLVACLQREVNRRDWRGHVEWHVVFLRQHRHPVGADLVRGVAVSGDAVGAHHYRPHLAGAQKMSDHVICDQRKRNAVLVQLPRGEARALQEWSCFGHEHFDFVACLDGHANYA